MYITTYALVVRDLVHEYSAYGFSNCNESTIKFSFIPKESDETIKSNHIVINYNSKFTIFVYTSISNYSSN